MVNETVAKEAVSTALMAVQAEYTDLERTAMSVCQELKGEGAVSGSSVISRLRALGGQITEHACYHHKLTGLINGPRVRWA